MRRQLFFFLLAGAAFGQSIDYRSAAAAGGAPDAHAASHQDGGSDEVATATPGAAAIPKAGGAGTLATGWLPVATTSAIGAVELATDGEDAADRVVQGNDSRLDDARAPTAHAASHTDGTDDIQSATSGQKGLATATQITKLDGIEAFADVTDSANVSASGATMSSLFDAHTILSATPDDTPAALTVAEESVVGRVTGGNISALTFATLMQQVMDEADTLDTISAVTTTADWLLIWDATDSRGYKIQVDDLLDETVGVGGGGGSSSPRSWEIIAGAFEVPANASWAVNSLAPYGPSTLDDAVDVHAFDANTPEGLGYRFDWPSSGCGSLSIGISTSPGSDPGGTKVAYWEMYGRSLGAGTAIDSWSSVLALGNTSYGSGDAFFRPDTFSDVTAAEVGCTPGETCQIQFMRDADHGSDDLAQDAELEKMVIQCVDS